MNEEDRQNFVKYAIKRHDDFTILCKKMSKQICEDLFIDFEEKLSGILFGYLAQDSKELIEGFKEEVNKRDE